MNHLARFMATPRVGDCAGVRRLLRYLRGKPICRIRFERQPICTDLVVYSDSDWAGCKVTRKSTSGTVLFLGKHLLSFACRLQKSVALSSGEAELVAQTAGVGDALGVRNLLSEFGIHSSILSLCDSSAARGICNRSGVGRLRHLELRHLWIQGYVRSGVVVVRWISRRENPSDALTHVASGEEFWRHMIALHLVFSS